MNPIKVNHKGQKLIAVFSNYFDNGRTAIELIDEENGEVWAVATVNVPQYQLNEGEIIIKDWSENEGITQALIDAKIIEEPHFFVDCGYEMGDVCKLKVNPSEHQSKNK